MGEWFPMPSDSFYEPLEPPEPPIDMTCERCGHCKITPDQASEYGWCTEYNDWILLNEKVVVLDCYDWIL